MGPKGSRGRGAPPFGKIWSGVILLFSLPVDLTFTSTNLYIMVQYWGLLVLGRYLYDRYAEKKRIGKSAFVMIIGLLWIIGRAYYVSKRKRSHMDNMF